jgi:hypothetical protein
MGIEASDVTIAMRFDRRLNELSTLHSSSKDRSPPGFVRIDLARGLLSLCAVDQPAVAGCAHLPPLTFGSLDPTPQQRSSR